MYKGCFCSSPLTGNQTIVNGKWCCHTSLGPWRPPCIFLLLNEKQIFTWTHGRFGLCVPQHVCQAEYILFFILSNIQEWHVNHMLMWISPLSHSSWLFFFSVEGMSQHGLQTAILMYNLLQSTALCIAHCKKAFNPLHYFSKSCGNAVFTAVCADTAASAT